MSSPRIDSCPLPISDSWTSPLKGAQSGAVDFTLLWDNDGVLVNTEGFYFQACRTALESVDVDLSFEQFQEISLRRGESTFLLATEAGVSPEEIERLRVFRNELYGDLLQAHSCVVDGAEEALRALHACLRMGVVTSSRRDHFEIAHAESGLLKYMEFVLAHGDYENSKPHPDPYLTAMKRHGLHPARCIVVEDSERGLASAKAAGLPCLIVRSEWTRDGDFQGAFNVLESIKQVPEAVREFLRNLAG